MSVLLVANNGGHIAQLHLLSSRLDLPGPFEWATVRTPQTETLLRGQRVHWMAPAPTRDIVAVVRNARVAYQLLRRSKYTSVVSTGSSLALSFLPIATMLGSRSYYIESATRTRGPSLTGRILQRVPHIRTFTQHERWSTARWEYRGSVLDAFSPAPDNGPRLPPKRIVVSLGTSESYPFRRLLERLIKIIPKDSEVLWQTGGTPPDNLPFTPRSTVPADEMATALRDADAIVAHAGMGIALSAFLAGKMPILVARRPELGEHVDGHQLDLASELSRRGLAICVAVDDLTAEILMDSTGRLVEAAPASESFSLTDGGLR